MTGTNATTSPAPATASTLVVLVSTETIGISPDVTALHGTIAHAEPKARILMLVMDDAGMTLAHRVAGTKLELELLIGAGVSADPPLVPYARMPACAKPNDLEELALGLADVVLAEQERQAHDLVRRAKNLGKPVIAPGMGLPILPVSRSVSERLDPQPPPGSRRRHFFAGRVEQFSIELFGLFVPQEDPFKARLKRVADCLRVDGSWGPKSWFPPQCKDFAPDCRAYLESSAMVARFAALDRSAVLGAYRHRDLTWIAHFGAAWAVFAAVAGAVVSLGMPDHGAPTEAAAHVSLWIVVWGGIELALLMLVVGIVLYLRHGRLQDRWTACRLGAEQLRIARMCLPLLVLQRALISPDVWPGQQSAAGTAPDLTPDALSEVKRAIRDHGLPRPDPSVAIEKAARWVKCIVDDQAAYHSRTHRKLHCAESSLRVIAGALFVAAFVAVTVQLASQFWRCLPDPPWILLLTAAGPAFAAALHGAATRLAIVHRIALSRDVEAELRPIQQALAEILHRPEVKQEAWVEIRDLAFRAADAMGRENQSWLGLVRLQQDTLPA